MLQRDGRERILVLLDIGKYAATLGLQRVLQSWQ